jgi:hypothetical protein
MKRNGLPRGGKVVAVFTGKGWIACRERYRKLCWTHVRGEDQLQEPQAEVLARLPPLAES